MTLQTAKLKKITDKVNASYSVSPIISGSLLLKIPLKLRQNEVMRRDKIESETDLNGNVIVPCYDCVTSHTARRTGITNMYLSHKYTILQMMHVSVHKTHKTFMDYIKLSSEEIADEIADMAKKDNEMW